MARFANIFVIFCMAIVAVSLGIVFRLQFGFSLADSIIVTLAFLAVFMGVHLHTVRRRDYDELMDRADEIERQNDLVLEDLRSVEKRLMAWETRLRRQEPAPDLEPVMAEVEVLGTIIKQVAETIADFERRLAEREAAAPPPPAVSQNAVREPKRSAPPESGSSPVHPAAEIVARPVQGDAPTSDTDLIAEPPDASPPVDPVLLDRVRKAVDQSRIDLYLQPIVTLPQRKTRYYEALSRLRVSENGLMLPGEFLPLAEHSGVVARIDNLLILRAVQILRRLTARNKDTGIFCNLSSTSLTDSAFFNELVDFMEANRPLADHLVFEFSQNTVRTLGPLEHESLKALVDLGYRLSVDQITDMRMDLGNLSERGFKFAKISADRLLSGAFDLGADIHPEDLASLMARNGIELIVDRTETETQVVELLDYNVSYAQGFLFSPPRPVRAEVFQGFASDATPKAAAG
ncbi:MAG: EAL domain-containing protein [Pseudomonadota bacterium]